MSIWLTVGSLDEAKHLDFLEGARDAFNFYLSSLKKRSHVSLNVYLILKKENTILLHLRKNTGYCDGFYGFVAGHVENNEPATLAMLREAKEEIGIELDHSSLRVVHVMHRKTNRLNIDIFFECNGWEGEITNMEPEKCASVDFFSIDDLPSNTIDYVKQALQAILAHEFYSEVGWI